MPILCAVILAAGFLFQAGGVSAVRGDVFTPGEKARLERETDVEKRMKVYKSASERMQKSLEAAAKENFKAVPGYLRQWMTLLSISLEDIESNLQTKKKSRDLIRYEIHVRKAITRTESLKIRAPVEQQDIFDSFLAEAEGARKRFVEILFKH